MTLARDARLRGTILLGLLVFCASTALAIPPRTPIMVSLSLSTLPALDEPSTLTVEVQSVLDAPGTVVELLLPDGVTAERTQWAVDLKAGKPVTFTVSWSFVAEPGNVSLSARATRMAGPGEVWGDMASVPLHLSSAVDRAVEGWRVDKVPVAGILVPGDALVVSTEPTRFSFAAVPAPGATEPPPPSVEPARQPVPLPSAPAAPGTVTLIGRMRYADRSGILRDLDQQLLEIRHGDGTALSPRVYCYTGTDGTFFCSLPYPGTTLRVWARSYTALSFGSGSTNRLGVFSGIEVTGGCGSDSIDCTYAVETPEIACGDGQTCDVGDQYVPLGEPWSGAHQMTQDLIRSWKKIWFDDRHPADTAAGPGRITYPVPFGHGTHAHVGGIYDGWISIEPPYQRAADAVLHEYGHVVMSNLWVGFLPYWPDFDCPSPHYINLPSGSGCALSEGFANFWAWYGNEFYDGDSSTTNDGPVIDWPSGASTNLETRGASYGSGDEVEGNVAASLGDLLDSANEGPASGPGDRVTDGVQHIWHTLYTQSDSNFSEWWYAYGAELGHDPCSALAALEYNTISYNVAQCNGIACYPLTRTHTGSGTNPGVSPAKSPGCPTGQYTAGQSIQLTAGPDVSWIVGSWSGTSNNASTALTNALVMPASGHTVGVQYVVPPDITLSNGIPVDGSLQGIFPYDLWKFYYVDLPSGLDQFAIDLYNLTANADLFVRRGDKPTSETYDCASTLGGTAADRCVFASPAAGPWWIAVVNVDFGSTLGYTVRATWSASSPAESFFTLTPCRVLDTRTGLPLSSQVTRTVPVAGLCGVPASAKSVAVNLAVVLPTGDGHLTIWPSGAKPAVSAINFRSGWVRANNAILPLASDASGTLLAEAFLANGGTVHLLIDVVGYFE